LVDSFEQLLETAREINKKTLKLKAKTFNDPD